MDCKEFERQIPDFIDRRMDFARMKTFCEHLEHCEECREELVIQFLVTEGMARLEGGDAFDLQHELDNRLAEAQKRISAHFGWIYAGEALEVLTVICLLGFIGWILF